MKNNTEQVKQTFFTCECYGDAIHVMKFNDEDLIYFSIWHRKNHHKPSLWMRLRHIWKIISTGEPYGDEVILNKQISLQLSKWIQNQLKH